MNQASNPHGAAPVLSERATSVQIISIVLFSFICYLVIGLPLAVLPSYVHLSLGFSSLMAGIAISVQYLATLASRAMAGRMADSVGPRQTVLYGLIACGVSGVLLLLAFAAHGAPGLSLAILVSSRLALGVAESWVTTGSILWAIGRVGGAHTARVLSWNGITTYGALALGAPLGVFLDRSGGLVLISALSMALALIALAIASARAGVPIVTGERLPYRQVFGKMLPYGLGLALGSVGFGAIATFITLFYASRGWPGAAYSLTAFGALFVGARLVFGGAIKRYGGHRVAMISFGTEAIGLALLWLASTPSVALLGAAVAGLGFAMIFPSLGVEAMSLVPMASRGAALSVYSVFLDLALGVTGPLAGLIAGHLGYPAVFSCASVGCLVALGLSAALFRQHQHRTASHPL